MCIAQKIVDKRSARKAENRIAIMDAAEKLVLAGGLKALTADALAKESGVSRRTIFNHFSSVEAAVVDEPVLTVSSLGPTSASPEERIPSGICSTACVQHSPPNALPST